MTQRSWPLCRVGNGHALHILRENGRAFCEQDGGAFFKLSTRVPSPVTPAQMDGEPTCTRCIHYGVEGRSVNDWALRRA